MFNEKFDKRANIQISLSWLFMIIIGTFFLYIAYNIIGTYSENEETKYYIEVKSALSNVLLKAGKSTGYEENYIQPLDTFFKDSRVEIICNNGLPLLSINEKIDDNVDFLKNIPTFMTVIEEGDVSFTYLAVENFRTPFKVTNMMAIVSKKNLIVFDSNSEITKLLSKKFSDSAYRNSLSLSQLDFSSVSSSSYNDLIREKDIQSIMFVSDYDSSTLGLMLDELNVDSYHLQFIGDSDEFMSGKLIYTDRYDEKFEYDFIDYREQVFDSKPLSMPTMAVFSNPTTFECGQNLVIESTQSIFEFYENKVEYLISVSEFTQVCSNDVWSNVGNGVYQVEKYEELRDEIVNGTEYIMNNKFNNSKNLYIIIEKIQELSQGLSDDSCEMIY